MTPTDISEPTRTEVFIGWLLHALLDDLPAERRKAFAWNLDAIMKAAKAKGSEASEAEIGAAQLAEAFLDNFRRLPTG